MKIGCVSLLSLALLTAGWIADADQKPGAVQMELFGGKRGKVPFPHRRHQTTLNDCGLCHSLYPQEAGVIEAFKARGDLKRKQVMNKQCTACHKERKRAGEKTGPTSCAKCHQREG